MISTKTLTIAGLAGALSIGITTCTADADRSAPVIATTSPPSPAPVAARSADSFVDSVGINVHFNYYGSIYTNDTPGMIQRLQALGVRHLRDAMCWQGDTPLNTFYKVHAKLGALGFKTDYIAGFDQPIRQVALYPALAPDEEAVEAANEYDNSGDVDWVAHITAQQSAIYKAIRASGAKAGITVLAPSLAYPANAGKLGDVSAIADAGNLHGYFGGFNPGSSTSNAALNLKEVQPDTPNKPIWVTETGYFAQPGPIFGMYGVSAAAQAVYLPRTLLEYFNAGAARTYIYELADDVEPGQDARKYHWGVLNADGSAKPSFGAVSHLLTMLRDPGPRFTPSPLAFSLQDADATVHQALFQKRDGSWYLALWVEAQSYDFVDQKALTVPVQEVRLWLAGSVESAETTQWDQNGEVTTRMLKPSHSIALSVSDKLQVVKLMVH